MYAKVRNRRGTIINRSNLTYLGFRQLVAHGGDQVDVVGPVTRHMGTHPCEVLLLHNFPVGHCGRSG